MTIKLRPDLARYVDQKVEAGLCADAEAFVNDLVEMQKAQEDQSPGKPWTLEDLRREIAIGIEQADRGEFVEFDAETIIREGRRRMAEKGRGDGADQPNKPS